MKQIDGDKVKYATGATRSSDAEGTRYDLISPIGLRRLAETYAEGAAKHGDRNWENGQPASDVMNHAVRHLYHWLSGDRTDDHLAHAAWGLFAIMHFEEKLPSMIDVPSREVLVQRPSRDSGAEPFTINRMASEK